MIDLAVSILSNPTGAVLLGFLLIAVPSIGIMIIHAAGEKNN